VVGTALEFFDFALYAAMAALVLGQVFLPVRRPGGRDDRCGATFAVGSSVGRWAASCSATGSAGAGC
jgi:hypothetical protein